MILLMELVYVMKIYIKDFYTNVKKIENIWKENNMDFNEVILKSISEKKGFDILVYDMRTLTPFIDTMIVCSTNNLRQNYAIATNIKDRLKEAGYKNSIRMEGDSASKWILMDLNETVVHLFVKEERQVYQLDRLYCDVQVKRYDL